MLLVDELISLSGGEAVSRTVFSPDSIFALGSGELDEALLFEMMAQTFAAAAALEPKESPPGSGFLVGLKKIKLRGRPKTDRPLYTKTKVISRVEDFSVLEGEVRQNDEILASGQLTVYVPGEVL